MLVSDTERREVLVDGTTARGNIAESIGRNVEYRLGVCTHDRRMRQFEIIFAQRRTSPSAIYGSGKQRDQWDVCSSRSVALYDGISNSTCVVGGIFLSAVW